jgi:HEPN domain-containing protein
MSKKEIEFLKERSRKFFLNAFYLFRKGHYDLCAFNLEQSSQLYLKYLIVKKIGDWPKTHYLQELIKRLSEVYEKPEINNYLLKNEIFFDDLTDAYFTSRYLPKTFNRNLVKKMVQEYKKFLKFIEKTLNEKLIGK